MIHWCADETNQLMFFIQQLPYFGVYLKAFIDKMKLKFKRLPK